MNQNLFPYCLERSTNIPKQQINEMVHKELLDGVDQYHQAILDFETTAADCIKILEQEYGNHQESEILKAKRKMSNQKHVSQPAEKLNSICIQTIDRYNEALEYKKQCLRDCKDNYEKFQQDNRATLKAFIENNHNIRRTLPLINKDFNCKLNKYLEVPVEKHNAKIKKLDHQLVRLMARATMKTSPFSFLTSVCLYDMEQPHKNEESQITSICEINNYIMKAIYDYVIEQKQFAVQVSYRLQAFEEYEDCYLFLSQKDYEKGKVYKTVDVSTKIKKSPIMTLVINAFAGRVFEFEELVEWFVTQGLEREKAIGFSYEKLVKTKIITPNASIDETNGDVFTEFYRKIGMLNDDENQSLLHIVEQVQLLEDGVRRFSDADWVERFDIVQKQDMAIAQIEKIVNREFTHNIIMYEDSIYRNPKKPMNLEQINYKDLVNLQRYVKIFDQGILTYMVFSDQFKKVYGDAHIRADHLDVYKLFVQSAAMLDNVWKDNFSEINLEVEDKIRQISQLKKRIHDHILQLKSCNTPQNIKEFIDSELKENEDIFNTELDSATLFIQMTDQKDIVINKIYKGQLLFFTRFLKLFEENHTKIENYKDRAFGANPAEITESFGFNANVHQPIFDKRLVLNLTDKNDPTDHDLEIKDCYFYYSEETNGVKLAHEQCGEINGIYLGSLAYNLMPVPLRTINGMQPTTRFDTAYLNLWDTSEQEALIADHIPRIQYNNIVFMREQFLINSIYDLNQAPEELYIDLVTDFKKNGLPMRFFIRPYINGADFDFYNMGRTSLKPQYVDLASPLLFQELLRQLEKNAQFILEEIYPDNEKDDYIYEYQIEQTLRGKDWVE